jgi:putative DNA methylase
LDEFTYIWDSPLVALTTFSDLVHEARTKIIDDAKSEGIQDDGVGIDAGGVGATAYGDAVSSYLALVVDKSSDYWSTICSWHSSKQLIRNTFGRQAIPMTWDYAETNPFSSSAGNAMSGVEWANKAISLVPTGTYGKSSQLDASQQNLSSRKVVSTDPPYYDNIGYADLSDFFYVWLRRALRQIYPNLFSTMAVPKSEELVATPYRHGNKEKAERFFLQGMTKAIGNLAKQAHPAFPVTIYYAFKQSETKGDTTSNTGWETFLDSILKAGFSIDGTWPMRTELGNRMISFGTNALASSIVLVCRKRSVNTETVSRRDFQRELRAEMPEALETMIGGESGRSPIAPVDLAQAAIGPGMAIFSRYAEVLNQDGSQMSVHDALILINREITNYLSPDSGNFDADTMFCSGWFDQCGWAAGEFGLADTLARAKGTSVDGAKETGVIESGGGKVRLFKWAEYPEDWDPKSDNRTPVWEATHHLIRALNQQGEGAAGALLARMPERGESIRQLAYHLYTLCERKKWAEEARAYNELIESWNAIVAASYDAGHSNTQAELHV